MIVKYDEFNQYTLFKFADVLQLPKGNRGTKKKHVYKDLVCAFDIETTLLTEYEKPQSIMYIWQFQIDDLYTVYGRTWQQLQAFLKGITEQLNDNERICVYVHNLAYEFQFLAGIYDFKKEDVFLLDTRRPVKCLINDCIELRCSYIQSNMSLDAFTHKMGVQSPKLHDFDYTKKRYFDTELTPDEIAYCVNDVKGLVQAIKVEMQKDGDNLYTIPLTSTGYVRRDFKKSMRGARWVLGIMPDYEIYKMLREAFRGGNTHASRFQAGYILDNVKSADRSSSYPAVQINHKYPVSRFLSVTIADRAQLERIIYIRNKPVLMRVHLSNVHLKDDFFPVPYLSRDKSRHIINGVYDNGRILSCDSCDITITDIDYKIINNEYNFDLAITSAATSQYGYLPKEMTEVVQTYYKRKTALKNVPSTAEIDNEYYYMKSKNLLNSVYGCTAQDPVKETINFIDGEYVTADDDPQQLLADHNRKAFIAYQWGVWCTAWARWELEEGINIAHKQGIFVYCDTDSVKYTGEVDWSEYNTAKIAQSKKRGAFATDAKGQIHYMGVFEADGEYKTFKTLGAKKYAYTDDKDTVHITVAGVPKINGAQELAAAGGLKAFNTHMVFKAGKLQSVYNDNVGELYYTTDKGAKGLITRNVALVPTEYHLGITAEYAEILENAKIFRKVVATMRKSGKM